LLTTTLHELSGLSDSASDWHVIMLFGGFVHVAGGDSGVRYTLNTSHPTATAIHILNRVVYVDYPNSLAAVSIPSPC